MFARSIVESDEFSDLPTGSKLLYFIIGVFSDDEGFCKNAKMLMKIHDIEPECLEKLVETKYIIQIGKIVIVRHWLLNNQIRRDRFHPSNCLERTMINVENDTKIYYLDEEIKNINSYFTPLPEYKQSET